MKNLIALIIIGLVIILMPACSTSKLHTGFYTYKQVRAAGYDCKPFKGKRYLRLTADCSKVNVVKL